jgi:hypothetical protein
MHFAAHYYRQTVAFSSRIYGAFNRKRRASYCLTILVNEA